MPAWKRRLIALTAGLMLGAAITAGYLAKEASAMKSFAAEYVAAQQAKDIDKLVALHHWEGVPDAERARMKLVLAQELDLTIRSAHLEKVSDRDGTPRETKNGTMTPNLTPEFRLVLTFGDKEGSGFSGILVGKAPEGYRVSIYKPVATR